MPRVTFGLIVLNGEPFTRYNLRALYPFAHQIVVVEGAVPAAAAIATPDGHSTDGTREVVRVFQATEDPERKVQLVTAEDAGHPNGFWPGEKDEQSRAWVERATGEYIWQVDVDEFYRAADIRAVLTRLAADPAPTAVSFRQIQFWGGFDSHVDGWYLQRDLPEIHRVFRWRPGSRYLRHRPPTVLDPAGRDVRAQRPLTAPQLARQGVFLYHYSLVFPRQVTEKCAYYGTAAWAKRAGAERWAREVYGELRRPFRAHNVDHVPGWLERFRGAHPEAIEVLRRDIASGAVPVELRPTADIDALLATPWYRLGRAGLKALVPVYRLAGFLQAAAGGVLRRLAGGKHD